VFFFRNLRSDAVETGVYLESEMDFCPPTAWMDPERHAAILGAIEPRVVAAAMASRLFNIALP
jgi:hypothetical protein